MVNAVITNPASCITQVAGLYFKAETNRCLMKFLFTMIIDLYDALL